MKGSTDRANFGDNLYDLTNCGDISKYESTDAQTTGMINEKRSDIFASEISLKASVYLHICCKNKTG